MIKTKLILLFLLLASLSANAQMNYYEFKDKNIYFGINMGLNFADFKFKPSPKQAMNDSVLTFRSTLGPGFNLGIITNLQFHRYFDLRFVPTLSFSDKKLEYQLIEGQMEERVIESIYLDFPLSIRFKSKPIKDFRVFVLAGIRYDYDLASNSGKRQAGNQVKISKHDLSIEYGIGLQFYYTYFIFSPELKISHGLINIHSPDSGLIYSRVIDKLFSRAFTISINLEG